MPGTEMIVMFHEAISIGKELFGKQLKPEVQVVLNEMLAKLKARTG